MQRRAPRWREGLLSGEESLARQQVELVYDSLGAGAQAHSVGPGFFTHVLPNLRFFSRVSLVWPVGTPESHGRRQYERKLNEARARQELLLLRMLQHDHVVRLQPCPAELQGCTSWLFRLTQLCDSELPAHVARVYRDEAVPSTACCALLSVLLGTVAYLHSKSVCHRRLHPRRLLLARPTTQWWKQITLCGFADGREYVGAQDLVGIVGERRFAAPEMLSHSSYTSAVDVWSAAAVVGSLALPGRSMALSDAALRSALGAFSERRRHLNDIPSEKQALLRSMLAVRAGNRPQAHEAATALRGAPPGAKRKRCAPSATTPTPENEVPLQAAADALASLGPGFTDLEAEQVLLASPRLRCFRERFMTWLNIFREAHGRYSTRPLDGGTVASALLCSDCALAPVEKA